VQHLGAKGGMRGAFQAADLPGVNLTFSPSPEAVVGTRGRSLDHIGFEVRDLEAFCKKLEAAGVKFDRPYRSASRSSPIRSARMSSSQRDSTELSSNP
jgi:hypothetical protein